MRRIPSTLVAFAAISALATGCSRSPAESFNTIGFRGMRVVFVSDSADVVIKDLSERVQKVAAMPRSNAPEVAIRQTVGNALYTWGDGCGSQYIPKRVSWDPRMGLAHATDGWNVGDAAVLRSYTRTTNTDYIVVLNRVNVRRGDAIQCVTEPSRRFGHDRSRSGSVRLAAELRHQLFLTGGHGYSASMTTVA